MELNLGGFVFNKVKTGVVGFGIYFGMFQDNEHGGIQLNLPWYTLVFYYCPHGGKH